MEILEQQLLELIKKSPNIGLKELKGVLKLSSEETGLLTKKLYDLEVLGMIYKNKNDTYCLLDNKTSICCGKAHILPSGDVLVTNSQNIKVIIPNNEAEGILEKDVICAKKMFVDSKQNIYGKVDKIIKRNANQVSCEVKFIDGKNVLVSYHTKSQTRIRVNQKEIDKYGVGEILLVRLTTYSSQYDGVVAKSIGHKNEPDVDEKTIAYNHGFEVEFNQKVIKELEKIPGTVDTKKALKEGRKDLRDKNIFTIDGSDTKDIDDAVGVEVLPNGNYKIYVCIADVPYYVKEGSAIDTEAYDRATSVYMNNTVVPMLPAKLSNGICSLHPGVNRLTKTCEMIVNKQGKVVDYEIYSSMICSKKKMTYEDVNKILIDKVEVEGYEPFYEDLRNLQYISHILNKAKEKRGYLNLGSTEIKVKGKGETICFEKRTQRVAEEIIENIMLLANETIAQDIFNRGLPFIYRVHEAPNEENITDFLNFLETMGLNFKKCKSITSNKYLQNVISEIINTCEEYDTILELFITSSIKRAKYSNMNLKHFGLALKCYTHFTSPIRRYADLQVHRLLNLYNNTYDFDYNELDKFLKEVAIHCSERSNEADKAEREAREMRMAEFMENNIGKNFEGVITYVCASYLKVKTKEGFSGIISVRDLSDDDYKYNKNSNSLTGENTSVTYMIGMPIKVIVKESSKKYRTIKFTTEKKQIQKIKKRTFN